MKCITQTVNPYVNYRLLLIITYQYCLINCNKCTTLMRDGKKRGNWVWGEVRNSMGTQ